MSFRDTTRYKLRRELGRGGMGVVYAAYDRERATEVALKTISNINPTTLFRFKHEFRALADVEHPNLVALYELNSDNGEWFFTMELLEGADILSYVCAQDPPATPTTGRTADPARSNAPSGSSFDGDDTSPTVGTSTDPAGSSAPQVLRPMAHIAKVRTAFIQLADGVNALHSHGHLHRDIKPSNVLANRDGRIVLLDFGVITELTTDSHYAEKCIAGTPAYMAPEQAASVPVVCQASDWYSLGVMLYEALAGRRPFYGSYSSMVEQKLCGPTEPPEHYHQRVPADLSELCMELLHPIPDRRPGPEEISRRLRENKGAPLQTRPEAPPHTESLFVGRERELATIREAFHAARNGRGNLLYVSGPSGMGKSLLVRSFLDEVRAKPNAVILQGRCFQQESVPYKALDGLVDALSVFLLSLDPTEIKRLLPYDTPMLARLFPVLNRLPALAHSPLPPGTASDPHEVKRRATIALRDLLTNVATDRPVVICIDDLQWGDLDSAPFLEAIVRPPQPPPMLLLASFRSEERERSPLLRALFRRDQRLGPAAMTHEVLVGALERQDALALARRLEQTTARPIDIERLVDDAAAHPYFIQELVRYAHDHAGSADAAVSLDGLIASRARKQSPQLRRLLEIIAVAARPVPRSVIQQAAELDPATVIDGIRSLRAHRMVRTSGARTTDLVEPFHDRIRETIVRDLSPDMLRERHLALARALTAGGGDAETLFTHYRAAGEQDIAAEHAVAAGDLAARALAFGKAATLYEAALEVYSSGYAPIANALRIKLAEALEHAGDGYRAGATYLAAADAAEPSRATELRRRAAQQYLLVGNIDEGLAVIDKVLDAMHLRRPTTRSRALASLLWGRARLRLRGLRHRLRSPSTINPGELARIDACWSVAIGLVMVDTFAGASLQTQHLLLALRAGEPRRIARALTIESGLISTGGPRQRARAERVMSLARRTAEQVEDPVQFAWINAAEALTAYQGAGYRDATRKAGIAVDIWRSNCSGVNWELTSAELYRLWSLFYLGELREMSERLEVLLDQARSRGDLYAVAQLCSGLPSLAWLFADRIDEADELLKQTMARWSRDGVHLQHYQANFSRAHFMLYRGEFAEAYALADETIRMLKRGMLFGLHALRQEALHLRARCALAAAAADLNPVHMLLQAERDARRMSTEREPMPTALSLLVTAGIASVRGDRDQAIAAFERAEAAAVTAELGLYATAARWHLGRLRGGHGGELLCAAALGWFAREAVLQPLKIIEIFVPG